MSIRHGDVYTHTTKMTGLIDRCATLWTAFSGDDPYGISTLQAGGAATSRYLSQLVPKFIHRVWITEGQHTGMVVMPSTSYMHGIANLSMEERRHIAVLFVAAEFDQGRQEERLYSFNERLMLVRSEVELLDKDLT
jgi:hypothetical protein